MDNIINNQLIVYISGPPLIQDNNMRNLTIKDGGEIALRINFFGAKPIHITWTHNDQILYRSNQIFIKNELQLTELSIKNVDKSHKGTYQLRLQNESGEAVASCTVYIQGTIKNVISQNTKVYKVTFYS